MLGASFERCALVWRVGRVTAHAHRPLPEWVLEALETPSQKLARVVVEYGIPYGPVVILDVTLEPVAPRSFRLESDGFVTTIRDLTRRKVYQASPMDAVNWLSHLRKLGVIR